MTSCSLEAVITDLDGSLLNEAREIGSQDLETVRRLERRGIPVFVATGRHFELAARYVRQLGLSHPFLSSDGGVLYDLAQRRVLYHHPIPPDLSHRILSMAVAGQEEFYLHDLAAAYFSRPFGRIGVWQDYAAGCGPQDILPALGPLPPEYLTQPQEVMTIMLHHPSPELLAALPGLCAAASAPLYIAPQGRLAVVSAPEWNKGRGAEELSRRYGFSLRNTLALGDTENDLPLLRAVGWPVVPCSGDDSAKALALCVTASHNENPLTHALAQLFPSLFY